MLRPVRHLKLFLNFKMSLFFKTSFIILLLFYLNLTNLMANLIDLPVKGVITVKKDGTGDFNRIETALYFSQPGDIIEIQDSQTYPENLDLGVYPNRTIKAKEGEQPIIYGSIQMGTDCLLEGLKITYPPFRSKSTITSRNSGWTVKNCEIYDIPFNAQAFYMASTVENAKIINNRIHDGQGAALYITVNYDKGNNLIADNIFYNLGSLTISSSSRDNQVISNTFYKVAVSIQSASTIFKNNIVDSANFVSLGPASYNCFHNSVNITDNGNIVADPLFFDPGKNSFQLKSQTGRWDGSGWGNDADTSPCIDAGDPSSDYSNEPNGNRINIGADGNSSQASKSIGRVNSAPPAPQISILPLSPTQNNSLTCNIDRQLPDPNGDTVSYLYKWYKNQRIQDNLSTNTVPASNIEDGDFWECEAMATDGSLKSVPATATVRVQGSIARPDFTTLKTQYCWLQKLIDDLGMSGGVVSIPAGEYLAAPTFIDKSGVIIQGAGSGQTIIKPYKTSGIMIRISNNLQRIADVLVGNLTITAGETMNRGIGSINLFNTLNCRLENIIIKNCGGIYNDQGKSLTVSQCEFNHTESAVFTSMCEATVVSQCKFYNTDYWWPIDFQSEKNGTVSHCEFYSCAGAVKLYSGAANSIISDNLIDSSRFYFPIGVCGASGSIIERNILRKCKDSGAIVVTYPYRNDNLIIRNNLVYANEQSGIEFQPSVYKYPDKVFVESNLIYGNSKDGIWVKPDNSYIVTAKNNILANNGGYGINRETAPFTSSYNDVWNNTLGNFNGTAPGIGDISLDPRFAEPVNGDFHLQSQYGRWNGSIWVNDTLTSPCLDAGDPASDYTKEPQPNGGRIDIGAYGNTPEASKSSFAVPPPNPPDDKKSENKFSVYPNPYIRGKSPDEKVTFTNLPAETIIKIYNSSGELIKELSVGTDGKAEWNVNNVSSGIYLYVVISPAGVKKGKVSIVK